jgi:hypothetical protein
MMYSRAQIKRSNARNAKKKGGIGRPSKKVMCVAEFP